eukprot:TRINITY_DN38682_c0_g1_i1.p1 TRINITY_DN38682_c0_g1~~TRINITY_DN38682_c0_g1_i1.p1  ORF type:complete len:108 (+),score=24.49 TRINITY_DN38682_c0_g1_i1:33-326(+)
MLPEDPDQWEEGEWNKVSERFRPRLVLVEEVHNLASAAEASDGRGNNDFMLWGQVQTSKMLKATKGDAGAKVCGYETENTFLESRLMGLASAKGRVL